jgi:hypothetical protein
VDGAYVGGVIAPGVNLSLEALHMAAAALPHVDVAKPAAGDRHEYGGLHAVGRVLGLHRPVEGHRARAIIRERGQPMKVIATGGLAPLFAQGTVLFDSVEDDLTMHGLTSSTATTRKTARMSSEPADLPSPRRRGRDRDELPMSTAMGRPGKERLIVVDLGVTFPDMDSSPGRRPDHARRELARGAARPAGGDLHHPCA